MNILVVGKFHTEGFALHIAETLAAHGHDVRRFQPGVQARTSAGNLGRSIDQIRAVLHSSSDNVPAIRASRMKALWRVTEQQSLDLVIVCHDFLWPGEVAELKRRTKAQVAMWFPDAFVNFGRAYFMTAPYDALFFKDPYIVHAMRDVLRSPVFHLPECFSPVRHRAPANRLDDDPQYGCDIATAGNLHSWRAAFFSQLTEYDIKLWGSGAPRWMAKDLLPGMHQGRGVYNEDKVLAFRGAKIVVNNLHFGEVWGVNARTFEAAGSGAFQLVDFRPGISQLFDDGRELVTFRGVADLKQKLDYWLPREAERREIAEAASRRAHRDHTYSDRLELMLATLEGKRSGFAMPDVAGTCSL